MNCTCSIHSPFRRLRESTEASIFLADPAFTTGAKKGQTASQIASATNAAFEAKHGYSLGTVVDLSQRSNTAQAMRQLRRK